MLAIAVALLASSLTARVAARAVRCDQDAAGQGPQPQLSLLRPSRVEAPPELRTAGGQLGDVLNLRGGRLADGSWVNWDGKLRSGNGWSSGGRKKASGAWWSGAKKRGGKSLVWPFEQGKRGGQRAQVRAIRRHKRQRKQQRNATARAEERLLREQLGVLPGKRQRNATARPAQSYRDQYLGPGRSGWRRALGRLAHAGSDPQYIARAVVDRTNAFRAEQGKAPLAWNDRAAAVARAHAEAMADGRAPFNHDGAQGRFAALPPHRAAGENLFMLGGRTVSPAAQAVQGWKESPGHRRNMLGGFNSVGVGVARGRGGRMYMTQILYSAAPPAQIQLPGPPLQGALWPAPQFTSAELP